LRLEGGCIVPEGPSTLVVLLHGIPSAAPPDPGDEGYPGLARRLAERGFAAAWADLRAARSAQGYFSLEGWVRDARAVIDAARSLVSGPVVLVGSSAGGVVAAEAARRGAPCDALALLASPAVWVTFTDDPAEAARKITEDAGMALAPEVLADPRAWADEFRAITAEEALPKLRVPVLIVHGTADGVVPVDHARRLAERCPRADLRIIEGGGHQLRRDERAVAELFAWLERVAG
jgi:alpha-beta hydrolase superfamily lysophospholipase